MYNTAQKQNAYHYMAAANVFHALGFMQMLDVYGEMPYTEAVTGNPSPNLMMVKPFTTAVWRN